MDIKLEKYVSRNLYNRFGNLYIRQNYRPEWLRGSSGIKLELDFYIDDLKIAAEIQGEQHYTYIPYFHKTPEGYISQRKRDKEKRILCSMNGIKLFEIYTEIDADLFLLEIKSRIKPEPIQKQLDSSKYILEARMLKKFKKKLILLKKKDIIPLSTGELQ